MLDGRAAVADLQALHEGHIAAAAKELMAGSPPHIRQVVLLLLGSSFARRHFPGEKEKPALLHPPYLDETTKQQLVQEIEERLALKIAAHQGRSRGDGGNGIGGGGNGGGDGGDSSSSGDGSSNHNSDPAPVRHLP